MLAVISFNLNVFSPLLLLVDQFVCHTEAIADIVILVDGSWSIGRLNFRLVRMFLENLVNAFDIGIDKTRIGGSQLRSFLNRWVHHGTNMVFRCLCKCFKYLKYSFVCIYVFLGLAQYSGDPRIEWHLNTYSTKDAVVDAVKNLPYKGGNTLTGVGFH